MKDFAIGLVRIQPQGELFGKKMPDRVNSVNKSEFKKKIANRLREINGLAYLSYFTYRKTLNDLKINLALVNNLNFYHFEHFGHWYAQKIEMNIQKRARRGELKWKSQFPFKVLKELYLLCGDLRKFKK